MIRPQHVKQNAHGYFVMGLAMVFTSINMLATDKEERDDLVKRMTAIDMQVSDMAGETYTESFEEVVGRNIKQMDERVAEFEASLGGQR